MKTDTITHVANALKESALALRSLDGSATCIQLVEQVVPPPVVHLRHEPGRGGLRDGTLGAFRGRVWRNRTRVRFAGAGDSGLRVGGALPEAPPYFSTRVVGS